MENMEVVEMIKLFDFLKVKGFDIEPKDAKIHCATSAKMSQDGLINFFYDGKFKEWQECQKRKNFGRSYIVSLIQLEEGSDRCLFVGIYTKNGLRDRKPDETEDRIYYDTTLLEGQDSILGRIIVTFDRVREACLDAEKHVDKLEITEILKERMFIEKFPGFNKICIDHQKLKTIIGMPEDSWRGALSNIKGIYLICDTKNGKKYVGSAVGEEGIWGRWCEYAKDGHGDNKELKRELKSNPEKIERFQYSILEIADTHNSSDISKRESYWKDVLLSRKFGYNAN